LAVYRPQIGYKTSHIGHISTQLNALQDEMLRKPRTTKDKEIDGRKQTITVMIWRLVGWFGKRAEVGGHTEAPKKKLEDR